MEEYDSIDEIDTHDEDLVIICERDELFGTPIDSLASSIRDEIEGDQLRLEQHPDGIARIERHGWLVQNSLWLMHCEQLLGEASNGRLQHYLCTKSIPKSTEIIVCVEDGSQDMRERLKEEYGSRIRIATSEQLLIARASTYLNTANPIRGRAGKATILEWNNAVCTILNELGEANHG